MRSEEILKLLRAAPFQPFRIHVSDGSSLEVRHPELAFVSRTCVYVAERVGRDEVPDRFVQCSVMHVTRLEPLAAAG